MSTIDAFVRVWVPQNELGSVRLGMAISTVARWALEPRARVTVVECEDSWPYSWNQRVVRIPAKHYTRESFRVCEERAEGDIYAGSDDDMLLYGSDYIGRGLDLMSRYPDYAYITGVHEGPKACPRCWKPTEELSQTHSAGGPALIRKGVITEYPDLCNNEFTPFLYEHMKAKGYKQGYARDLRWLHLGQNYSWSVGTYCTGF